MPKKSCHRWTDEEKQYMHDHLPGVPRREFAQMFNAHFGLQLSESQIIGATKRYGFRNGLDFRFSPGQLAHNKGIRVCYAGCEKTWFKQGHMPHNHKPVGSERVSKNGYIEIKIAEPKTWRGKHLVIWENHNGKLPKGYAIVFGDGNRRNFDIDNLLLVSRSELLMMNKRHLHGANAEITAAGQKVARLYLDIAKRKRHKGGAHGATNLRRP